MGVDRPFLPGVTTKILLVANTSQVVTLGPLTDPSNAIRVYADLDAITLVHMKFGNSVAVAATTDDLPMSENAPEAFSVPDGMTHVAFISTSAGSVFVTLGRGS